MVSSLKKGDFLMLNLSVLMEFLSYAYITLAGKNFYYLKKLFKKFRKNLKFWNQVCE